MNKIKEIKNIIIKLIDNNLQENVKEISELAKSGSSRSYFRIFTENNNRYIATYNTNVEENIAFLSFTEHFNKINLPVPQILAVNDDITCYIQSDLGESSLFDYVNNCIRNNNFDDKTVDLYKQAIDNLVYFQIFGNKNLDYSKAYPSPAFDKNSIINDLNYFKYYFLKIHDDIIFNETRLNSDFQTLAEYLINAPSDFFMYRDFQSRNIIINNNKTYFIDYQGGRKGPLQYDIVSILYQVKAQLPEKIKTILLDYYKEKLSRYIQLDKIKFDEYYKSFILLRLLQVLGAYGFRGLIQKKLHFLESISYALKELISLNKIISFPFELKELKSVLDQIEILLPRYKPTDNEKLTVIINSFSYKKGGIPDDFSGNGGGFVFDCRALPNPGRYEQYKKLNGLDKDVQDFLYDKKEVHDFINYTQSIVNQSVNNYLERNFKNLFVNFGCTGGQHRSVFFAQKCADYLHKNYPQIKIIINHIVQNKSYIYETK